MEPREWSNEENKRFELLLTTLDPLCPDLKKVAQAIPGRSIPEVVHQFCILWADVTLIESGAGPFPNYPDYSGGEGVLIESGACPFPNYPDYGGGDSSGGHGGCGKHHRRRNTPKQERKKGAPWTEEEHRLFLIGLKRYGKGDWRNISRNFVQTRNPTQVASHAQKYFIRLEGGKGKKRPRPSIHDITTVDDQSPSPSLSQSEVITNQSNASVAWAAAAVGQLSLTADTKPQHGVANLPFSSPSRLQVDQELQCGPQHDQLVANTDVLFINGIPIPSLSPADLLSSV